MKAPIQIRRVVGSSMVPHLRAGQIVIARSCSCPKVGDCIIFRHDGLEKIKRVQKIEADKLFVLGDNPGSSTDSRQFGFINTNSVSARVVWPR